MPIRFNDSPRPEVFQVLSFHVDAPVNLQIGSDKAYRLSHDLHWHGPANQYVPCLHEDCPWCPSPVNERTFVPALVWAASERCWKQKVLPLTERLLPWLVKADPKAIYRFVRRKRINAPLQVELVELPKVPTPFVGFDVLPSLLRVWGQYSSYKRRANAPDVDRPRLFDAGDDLVGVG